MLDLIPWDVGAKALAANASVTGHLWTGLRNSASSVQITARGSAQAALHLGRESSSVGWMPTKPDHMSIETDLLMALLQTTRQGLKQESLTTIDIVSTSGGSIGVDR
jgi:hypothetical protein